MGFGTLIIYAINSKFEDYIILPILDKEPTGCGILKMMREKWDGEKERKSRR